MSSPSLLHVELSLALLISRADAPSAAPAARLDALERTIALVAAPWRRPRPIGPARELRMSAATLEELLAWVAGEPWGEGAPVNRLAVYVSGAVTDEEVPVGWIRVRLGAGEARRSVGP